MVDHQATAPPNNPANGPSGQTRLQRSVSIVAALATALATMVSLVSVLGQFIAAKPSPVAPSVAPSNQRLYQWDTPSVGSDEIGLTPFNSLFVRGDKEQWISAPGDSSRRISFRQAANVQVSLLPMGTAEIPTSLKLSSLKANYTDLATLPYKDGDLLCLEIAAGAFDISGSPRGCARLESGTRTSWAWSLYPKSEIAGEQVVTVTTTIERTDEANTRSANASGTTTIVAGKRLVRAIRIDVDRGIFDRYPTIVVGVLTAIATLVGIVVKAALDRKWSASDPK